LIPLVATKITHSGDVSIRTTTYPALEVAEIPRKTKKEVVLMRHENGPPAYRQRLAALDTAIVVVLAGLVAVTVVGAGKAIDLLVNYLVSVGVITGVIIAALALLVWVVKRLPESSLRDWYQ
jgi:hypothetical protein